MGPFVGRQLQAYSVGTDDIEKHHQRLAAEVYVVVAAVAVVALSSLSSRAGPGGGCVTWGAREETKRRLAMR